MNKVEINIGLFGCVSVGKSTFLNAISGQQYSDAEIKKTTMVPQVYIENQEQNHNAQTVRHINRNTNESILKMIDLNKFTIDQCQPLYHNIDKICDLFDPEIIDPSIKINIYDIPGLNDSASKNIYFEWVKQNIKLFDIIIFMTDITKGLNNSDEIEVLKLLMDSVKKYKLKMICLMNKCDDIYFDDEQNDLVFEEKEQENIYIQANDILVDIAKMYGINGNDNSFTPFYPISSENCFIYRALMKNPSCELDQIHQNRLCKNECGPNQWKKMTSEEKNIIFKNILVNLQRTYNSKIMDTGYLAVKSIIQNIIISNKFDFMMSHVENDLNDLELTTIENISEFTKLIKLYVTKMEQVVVFGGKISYDSFWKNIQITLNNHINNVTNINTKNIKSRDFKDFEGIHSMMQIYCMDFLVLIETLKEIPNYPNEFVICKEKQLITKLLNIYDQLCSFELNDHVHICPTNLMQYFQTIKAHTPNDFDQYVLKFLKFYCNPSSRYIITNQAESIELILYILNNTQKVDPYIPIICTILINKQQYIQNKFPEQYFSYLIRTKKLVNNIIKRLSVNSYTGFDVLCEVINKNISLYLSTNSVTNIYKQEINHSKIECVLNQFSDPSASIIDVEFESKVLNAFRKKLIN